MNLTKERLTNRESQIYNYLLKGLSLYDIADEVGTTRSTIATHVLHLYSKLLISSRYELMANRIQELEDEVEELKRTQCSTRT